MRETEVKAAVIQHLLRSKQYRLNDHGRLWDHGVDICLRRTKYGRYLHIEAKGGAKFSESAFLSAVGQILTRIKPSTGYEYGLAFPACFRTYAMRRINHEVLMRLRIDLFFAHSDGSVEQVDWKVARQWQAELPPTKPRRSRIASRQLPSGLDAAHAVLCSSREAMRADEIVRVMLGEGMWTSRGGTPQATIASAIRRDIRAKSAASRFRLASRGRFVAAPRGKTAVAQAAKP